MFLKDNLVLLSLLVLIVLVLALLGFVLRVATRPDKGKEAGAASRTLVRLRNDTLRASFRQAVELIEENLAARAQRYSLPWVLVLNEGERPQPLALARSGVAQALSTDSSSSAAAQGIAWHFFDKGIVIDMLGAYLGAPDDQGQGESQRPWDEFLGLCRDYRPERPFDAMVITVPAALLMDAHPDARLELAKLAKLANRRLWLAQNRFAMRFAVYVAVSGCERLAGFSAFSRALPEMMRKSLLGWSSPLELAASYQPGWVDEALNQTVQTLSDTSAELFALNASLDDSAAFFMLPGQFESLRPQLQLYVDELMRPSAYHEPFLLRGIYFTGDAGPAAEQLARMAQPAPLEAGALALAERAPGGAGEPALLEPGAIEPEAPAGGPLAPQAEALAPHSLMLEPVFLRDLFEQKIFAEYGLARPSNRQFLGKPLMGVGARWAAWVLIGGWSVGLVAGSLILHGQSRALHQVLVRLNQDSEAQMRAARNGLSLSPDQQNARALALLQIMEQLDTQRLWSVFMPGSWPLFDALPERVRAQLEQAFGEVAAQTLQRGLLTRVSRLTGVPQEETSGELIAGVGCREWRASDAQAQARETVGFEDVQEFSDLLGFVSAAAQIEQAVQALQRLQSSSLAPDGNDLRVLVKQVMGAELGASPRRSAELFRGKAARSRLALAPVQEAMRCSLRQAGQRLQARVFDNNDLLVSLRDLDARISNLGGADSAGANPDGDLAALQELLGAIKAQEVLLASGSARWTQLTGLQPGPAWERALAHIRDSQLLGGQEERRLRAEAEAGFQRFRPQLAEALQTGGALSLAWSAKEVRYEQGRDLIALRESLSALMAQPYMKGGRRAPGMELPVATAVSWDIARLDQALARSEQLKRFMAEMLVRFAPEMQAAIEKIVKLQLARQAMEQVGAAVIPGGRTPGLGTDLAVVEAERSRLVRLQQFLTELGAQHEAEALRAFVNQDALRRLQAVDESLQRSELYAIRGRNFDFWQGDKAPMLQALAVPDAASLQPYLAQQLARVEALSREADMLISLLDGTASRGLLAQRWQDLSRDLERYRLKNPNSSLIQLESFLLAMSGDVDAQNCAERVGARASAGRAGDYFAERLGQIEAALGQRCAELRQRDQQVFWSSFASDFNSAVAGRPPFAQAGWAPEAPAVRPEELVGLFKSYERARAAMMLAGRKATPPAAEVRRFIEQFDRSRAFLAPLYPAEEGAPAGLDLAVEFRANQGAEAEGNKVIDWTLEVGGQRLSLRDAAKPLRWEPGQPVQLRLRLAKDGPASLRPEERRRDMAIDGNKTVTFRYADAWALVSLLNAHRVADSRDDGRSQLLRFDFPLLLAAEPPAEAGKETQARVFLRLTLSPAGKRAPLGWPGLFPTHAPLPGMP